MKRKRTVRRIPATDLDHLLALIREANQGPDPCEEDSDGDQVQETED